MKVTIVDYNSGNISSVINSFKEVAKDNVNIEITADLNKIKSSDKVVLPGQGSFKSCLLYTSPSPRDKRQSRMPSSA